MCLSPLPSPCRHVRTLQAQSTEDEVVMLSLLEDKQRFLEKALKNYILCLRTGVCSEKRGDCSSQHGTQVVMVGLQSASSFVSVSG